MKEKEVEPQEDQENDAGDQYDQIDKEFYVEGAGDA